jgi:pSer/pThr/pTyr-binding forkhead associated (FHA) protein
MNASPAAYLVLTSDLRSVDPAAGLSGTNIPAKGHAFRLLPGKNVIGRLPDADIAIVLPELTVSRRHSRVECSSTGNWGLEDLGSRNGTHCNGQQLQPHSKMLLHEGDRIQVAGAELIFTFQPNWKDDREPSAEELEMWLRGAYQHGDH